MGRMYVSYRPLPTWPHGETSPRRNASFKVSVSRTITELLEEVRRIQKSTDSDEVVIGAGYREADIRLDGRPRADARAPLHPGVEISFDSKHGRLTYATDVYDDWRDNVRAVRLGLEALRAIDRYGVAKRGQQYTGFALLSAGPGLEEQGRILVERWGSIKEALRHTHPDTGDTDMTSRDYQAVIAFRESQRVAS